jgi:alpha-beta hydrolase superfamily lysophospholipase
MIETLNSHRVWQRRMKLIIAALGGVAGAALAAGAGIGYFVADQITRPARPSPMDDLVMSPFETGSDYEEVVFPSARGDHAIHAWWLPRPETDRVIIGCVGYRGAKWHLVGIGAALWRAGFNVLLFDYYGHGSDRGRRISLGYYEVNDFLAALDYAERRIPKARIGVIGYSMGGAIAIMGVALRKEVMALVADSPFTRHADVIADNVQSVLHLPGKPVAWLADYFLPRVAGYHHADVEPINSIAGVAPCPLLLIHGSEDQTVPVYHAYQNFAAAQEPKELWIGEGAVHCGTYFLNRSAYSERVLRFFEDAMGPALPVADHLPTLSESA